MRRARGQELAQLSLVDAWRHFGTLRGDSCAACACWLRTIVQGEARHLLRDAFRERRDRRRETVPIETLPENHQASPIDGPIVLLVSAEQDVSISQAIAELPEPDQTIARNWRAGDSLDKIAEHMQLSPSQVRVCWRRIKNELAMRLSPWGG